MNTSSLTLLEVKEHQTRLIDPVSNKLRMQLLEFGVPYWFQMLAARFSRLFFFFVLSKCSDTQTSFFLLNLLHFSNTLYTASSCLCLFNATSYQTTHFSWRCACSAPTAFFLNIWNKVSTTHPVILQSIIKAEQCISAVYILVKYVSNFSSVWLCSKSAIQMVVHTEDKSGSSHRFF